MNRPNTVRLYTGKDNRFFALEGTAREMYQKFSAFLRYAINHNQPIRLSLESLSHRIIATNNEGEHTVVVARRPTWRSKKVKWELCSHFILDEGARRSKKVKSELSRN